MENWVPAFEYEDLYEVSDLGNVRRSAGTPGCPTARPLKQVPLKHRSGYMVVSLWQDNRGLMRRVNRLIYQSFRGAIPTNIDVHHKNGCNTDNQLDNLEALTKQEHAALTPHACGEDHPASILTEEMVHEIRRRHRHGVRGRGYRAIALSLGVRVEYIRDVIKRKTWKHIQAVSA